MSKSEWFFMEFEDHLVAELAMVFLFSGVGEVRVARQFPDRHFSELIVHRHHRHLSFGDEPGKALKEAVR